jgi:hypothetical protein
MLPLRQVNRYTTPHIQAVYTFSVIARTYPNPPPLVSKTHGIGAPAPYRGHTRKTGTMTYYGGRA